MSLDNIAEPNPSRSEAPSQQPMPQDYPPSPPQPQSDYPPSQAGSNPFSSQPEDPYQPWTSEPAYPEYPNYPDFPEFPQQPQAPQQPPPQQQQQQPQYQPPQQEPQYQPPQPQYQPPPPREQPQYSPGDEPEALPIDESDEELLALEDGGEENPQNWAEPEPGETEAAPEEAAEEFEEITAPEEPEPEETLPEESLFTEEPLFNEEPEGLEESLFNEEDMSEDQDESSAPAKDKPDDDKLSPDSILGLMNYLKDLSSSLPENKRESFMQSDARRSMDHVIDALEGKKGQSREKAPKRSTATAGRSDPGAVPQRRITDKNLFNMLKQKVQSIMSRIKAVTDKRKQNG
jgi:hypothetical protein